MENQPLISIITPAYNASRFINETVQSVQNQDYKNWEHLIVIDHNSKDNTLQIVQKLSEADPRIKCITSPEAQGAATNRNIALKIASGKYVACLDADDLWPKNKLTRQVHFMETKTADFTFTAYHRIDLENKKQGIVHEVPEKVTYSDLLKNNSIACLTVLFKREPFADIQFHQQGWEDLSFWLQILKRIDYAYGLNEPLAYYRIVPGSRSNNKIFAAGLRWDTYRKVENMSLLKSAYYFSFYFVSALKKYVRF